MAKSTSRKMCEVVSNTEHLTLKTIMKVVKTHNAIEKYVYVLHDKDVYTIEDEAENPEHKAGTLKPAHWHIYLLFKNSQEFKYVAKWFGLAVNFVHIIKSKRYVDAVKYAIHKNAPEKYQYAITECTANFDIEQYIEDNDTKIASEKRKKEIINQIANGIIKHYNYTQYITAEENDMYKSSIQKAFEYRYDMLTSKIDRDMEVIYICGTSGLGKTTLAKNIAENKGYACCVSSSDNDPLQDYKGHECLILDDVSADSFAFKELLKLLDNNTSSTYKSRYRNKCLYECKLIIITNVENIYKFCSKLDGIKDEQTKQLFRRIGIYMELSETEIRTSVYDDENDKYEFCSIHKNQIIEKLIKSEKKTLEQKKESALKALEKNDCILYW